MNEERLGLTAQFWGKAKKLGLSTPAQLMWLTPAWYHDYRSPRRDLAGLVDGNSIYARLLVSRSPTSRDNGPFSLQVTDGKITADIAVFGDTHEFKSLSVNSLVHIAGDIGSWNGRMQIKNAQVIGRHLQGRLVPEYLPGESGLNRTTLSVRIAQLLEGYASEAVEGLVAAIGEPEADTCKKLALGFTDFQSLLLALHQPSDESQASKAKIAIELLASYQSLRVGLTAGVRPAHPEAAMPDSVLDTAALIKALPFPMTTDQSNAVRDIVTDLNDENPMHRILSGDVGCGKTVCYLIPAVAAQRANRQVVILMPNTLLASQVANELQLYYPGTPVARLSGGDATPTTLAHKPVIIGTTAILHWLDKQDPRPDIDLVIIDEQQKLGLEQKRSIMGPRTHFLEATATAIPRSQALVRFGISKVSRIEQMPVVKNIVTKFVDPTQKREVFDVLVGMVNAGHQIAVLYPQREEEDTEDGEISKRAVEQVHTLWERRFPGQVGWIHGGLKPAEKTAMLDRMRSGEVRIIITTSVIEIGLTLPDLKALMVVEAERYGASTLHQFRGRVARKGGEGVFYMMSMLPKSELKETAFDRLTLLTTTTKGMEIAEADLVARGFGDLAMTGSNQTGFEGSYLPGIKTTPDMVNAVLNMLDLPPAREAMMLPLPKFLPEAAPAQPLRQNRRSSSAPAPF